MKEKDGDTYRQFDEVEDRSDIFPTVLKYAYSKHGNNAFDIKVFLNGVRILSYTESTNPLTSSFMYYLSAEITYQNHPIVEICDIIHYDNDNVYLIHVKYGFDARIRDLTNQILISARRLNETKSSGDHTFLEKVYQQVSGLGRSTQGLGKTGFIDLFSKNIIYVLAMSSQLKDDLKIEEHIEKYTSNIARFSLITCSTDVRGFYEMLT